jgi:hypothetical protein
MTKGSYRYATYLVPCDRRLQVLVALGILVIRPDKDTLLARRHGKGPDAGHDVGHHLARLEQVDEPLVLAAQLRVPVDLGVVEVERAAELADLDEQVLGPREELVLERPELVVRADVVDLVDDGADVGVLV